MKIDNNDVIPKKFAVKFDPPVIALEYHLRNLNGDYLLQINLEESLKIYDDPQEICKAIFNTYSDILNNRVVSEKQVIL